MTLMVTTTGIGDVSASITTGPAMPGAEFWNLVSFQNYTPTGSGPLFGVQFSQLSWFL